MSFEEKRREKRRKRKGTLSSTRSTKNNLKHPTSVSSFGIFDLTSTFFFEDIFWKKKIPINLG